MSRFNFNEITRDNKADINKIGENFEELENNALALSDIIDNLSTENASKVLSALQGKILNDSKAPTNHAVNATTYGLGKAWEYGHCRVVNALTKSSYSDGEALSAHQGYLLNSKFSQYMNKSNFSVLTGSLTVGGSTSGTKTISYPSGFNQNNCVPIACGISYVSAKGYNYVGYYVNSGSGLNNAFTRYLNLLTNNLELTVINNNTSSSTFNYKIVLMKTS